MKEDDQDQFLMWMRKRREILMMNSINGSSSSSWDQEKAFSEDLHGAAGSLGGCVWPPRSYTCSFCMREFKSAQALGGHMNIHRRDRARLKQYCLTRPLQNDNISDDHHINHDNHDHHQYSLKLHPINSSPSTSATASIRFLSPNNASRVSAEQPFFSSTFSDHDHDLSAKRVMLDLESPNSEKNRSKLEDSSVETDLCVGLNNRPSPTGFCGDHDEYETSNYKRPKLLSFFFKPCRLQSNEVIDLEVTEAAVNNSMDDLDLELRLGEPPKVK